MGAGMGENPFATLSRIRNNLEKGMLPPLEMLLHTGIHNIPAHARFAYGIRIDTPLAHAMICLDIEYQTAYIECLLSRGSQIHA